jgi:transposase
LLSKHADFQLPQQVSGIGLVNARSILTEADDRRRFWHHRQFLKFCDLDRTIYLMPVFEVMGRAVAYD